MLIETKPILAENKGYLVLSTTKADAGWKRCSDDNYSAFYFKLQHNFWNTALSHSYCKTTGVSYLCSFSLCLWHLKGQERQSILHKGFYYKVVQGELLKAHRWLDACDIGKGSWKCICKGWGIIKKIKNLKQNMFSFPKLSLSLHLVCMLQMKIIHELVGNSASETWFASNCWGSNLEFPGSL